MSHDRSRDIAIVGMGAAFAQAPNVNAFWDNILAGRECFSEIPEDRWHNELFYSERRRLADKSYVTRGGFMDKVDHFAAMHFGIAPRRVQVMDPQHRLLYHTVRDALQDSGLETAKWEAGEPDPEAGINPLKTGVFLGLSTTEYKEILGARTRAIELLSGHFGRKPSPAAAAELLASVENAVPISAFSMPGSLLNMAAANIAHHWGMRGPAYSIDAACASALVAVYDAVTFLRAGLCDAAVAGGVYINLSPVNLVSFSRIGAISAQGRCRPFDANADGFLQGDGCGIVVLKRLDDALADGDRIRAVIRGVGINNDGNTSSGPMAPSHKGQLEVINAALDDGNVDPHTIGFVECHGTATPVGDPTEVGALRAALNRGEDDEDVPPVWLSSVKANIGHTMSAAGIAGLIKSVLVLENKTIPPQAAFEQPNEKLPLDGRPDFAIATSPQPWESKGPRRAGVSSFGFGGTNCHMVVEEAPARAAGSTHAAIDVTAEVRRPDGPENAKPTTDNTELVVLTAPTAQLLADHARRVADSVTTGHAAGTSLVDIAFTFNATRRFEAHRLAVVAGSVEELADELRSAASKLVEEPSEKASGKQPTTKLSTSAFYADAGVAPKNPRIAFMFPGQGAQRVGLLRELYEQYPPFRQHLDELAASVDGLLERPLLSYLYPDLPEGLEDDDERRAAAEEALKATEICQPAMAALGLALHRFFGDMDVNPAVTLGHSLGEFVACAAGGILDPADAVRFVARRGQAMAALELDDLGAMAAVMAPREDIASDIAQMDGVVMANFNSPRQTVISGTTAGVGKAVQHFLDKSIAAKQLRVSHAFHSPLLKDVVEPIADLVDELEFHPTSTPVVSAITGELYPAEEPVNATALTWKEHATSAVDFMGAINKAAKEGTELYFECGAGKTMATFARGTLGRKTPAVLLSPPKPDHLAGFHAALAQLVCAGQSIHFRALYRGLDRRVASLPLTPLVTESYWAIDPDRAVPVEPTGLELPEPGTTPSGSTADNNAARQQMEPSMSDASPDLVALFREQNEILRQHAAILAQQTAALTGGKPVQIAAQPAQASMAATNTTTSHTAGNTASGQSAGGATNAAMAPGAGHEPQQETNQQERTQQGQQAEGPGSSEASGDADESIDVHGRVIQAVAHVSAFPPDALRDDQRLATDLGFDSLMFVELGTRIEEAFPGFDGGIPQSLLSETTTIGDLVSYLEGEVGGNAAPTSSENATEPVEERTISLYEPELVARARSRMPGRAFQPDTVLITRAPGDYTVVSLAGTLNERGVSVVLAGPELDDLELDDSIATVSWSGNANDVATLFQKLATDSITPDAVIHGAGMGLSADLDAVISGDSEATHGVDTAIILAKHAFEALGSPSTFITLTGMGGLLDNTDGDVTPTIWQSGLLGFTRALAREWSDAQVRAIDLDPQADADWNARAVLAELEGADSNVEAGLRTADGAEERRVYRLRHASGSDASAFELTADDTVLILGGNKGLGFKTALALADRASGVGIVVAGRTAPTDDAVQANLRALQKAGARVAYLRWDVTEPAPEDLSNIREKLGPITGIVHSAGVIRDARVSQKNANDIRLVMGVKVNGLIHALQATADDPLRFVVGFSSWSAHYGNSSQTDYSAANELLNTLIGALGARADVAVSIMYPPWEDSEMARTIPGVVKRAMQAEGVPFLTDEEGLGALFEALRTGQNGAWLVGDHVPVDGRHVSATISMSVDSHPYLTDHQLKNAPVMPLASALDYVALAAAEASEVAAPLVIDELRLYGGVDVTQPTRLGIEVERTVWENGRAPESRIELRTQVDNGGSSLAYRAQIGLPDSPVPPVVIPQASANDAWRGDALPLSVDEFYDKHTFHGPRLRGVVNVEEVGNSHVIGTVRTSSPADWIVDASRDAWTVDPLVVDSAFQLVAYYLWTRHQVVAFPTGFERFVMHAPFGTSPVRCVVVQEPSESADFTGSIRFEDTEGNVLAVMHRATARILERAGATKADDTEAGSADEASTGVEMADAYSDTQESPSAAASFDRAPTEVSSPPVISGRAPKSKSEPSGHGTSPAEIDPKHWDPAQFQEVKELEQRLQMAEMVGIQNPYFHVHEGTARDTSVVQGVEMINFSSYNYLGFSGHPRVVKAAQDATERYGTSVSASRVASGERPLHRDLEKMAAEIVGVDDAIVLTAGHMTNETVIGHVFGEGDLIIHDMLAHNSIQQGAIMSGAKRRPFPHNDYETLDKLLTGMRGNFKKCVIIIEGVYSMDGDIPDLPKFIEVAKKHKCLLFVDEAHSIGVLGEGGRGIGEYFGIDPRDVDFWMGTLSKSFASCGGYIAGSKPLIEYLKYTAPAFVFSAGITPANAAAALEAMKLMLEEPETVKTLHDNSDFFLQALKSRGIDTGMSQDSAVVPCIVGNSFKCLQLSDNLAKRGINVQPIVYPAVEDNVARLRFFLSSTHTEQQLENTANILREELDKLEIERLPTVAPA